MIIKSKIVISNKRITSKVILIYLIILLLISVPTLIFIQYFNI